jgi:hypothetical protein
VNIAKITAVLTAIVTQIQTHPAIPAVVERTNTVSAVR